MKTQRNETKTGFLNSVREFLIGFTGHEHSMLALKQKAALDNLMMLLVFGDLLGVPVIKQYYALRLLPYVYPHIAGWKHSTLRERDWTDWAFD
ncbi:MAG: hypothetical protein NTY51_15590 [Deltaproteobacteria bacterium]|nr:hypothetical protein [Deltaproteobacteria bacterium]